MVPPALQGQYAAVLAEHVASGGEASLHHAYEFGRKIMAQGFGVIDQVMLHNEAVCRILLSDPPRDLRSGFDRAAEFLAESLSAFEMSLRGYHEANTRLAAANRMLQELYQLAGGLNRCRTETDVVEFSIERIVQIPGVLGGSVDMHPVKENGAHGSDRAAGLASSNARLLPASPGEDNAARGDQADCIHVPLIIDAIQAGVLQVRGSGGAGGFTEDERKSLISAAHQISNAVERARIYESLERKVEERTAELVRAAKIKDDFLAVVSHELRTPLTSINAVITLLDAGKFGPLPPSMRHPAKLAFANCRRLMKIVNDLLDQTRISNGTVELELQSVELHAILAESYENYRMACTSHDLRFEVTDRARHVCLFADAIRLQQVVDNLLTNAVKFSGVNSPILLAADRYDQVVRISVADRGVGIPTKLQEDVFKPFIQVNSTSTRSEGGVGLGLTIAKAIVEAHRAESDCPRSRARVPRSISICRSPLTPRTPDEGRDRGRSMLACV